MMNADDIKPDKKKRRLSLVLGLSLSLAVAATSFAYIQGAGYVQRKEIGPGIMLESAEASMPETKPDTKTEDAGMEKPAETPAETNALGPLSEAPVDEAKAAEEAKYIVKSGGRELDLRKPMIALTFDDGPDSVVGNEIMDSLEQYDGRATFFLVGDRVASRKTVVKRMASNGHELANHSMNHKNLKKQGAEEIRRQVEACNNVIEEVSGVRPVLMRLPGGNRNELVMQNIGMPVILWNIDTRDWATKDASKTVASVVGKVKDGDIVLMHELYKQTAEAVRRMLPELKEQGFQFVTVSELIKYKGKAVEPNKIYYHFHP